MATGSGEWVTISSEHFLGPLGLPQLAGALPQRRRELYAAVVEMLAGHDLVRDRVAAELDTGHDLELRIPGTPVHVHVSAIKQPQLNEIVTLLGGLGLHHSSEYVITLTGLQALARLFSLLRTEYGELSVVEVVSRTRPPTADAVVGVLHGSPCRHPKSACRFMSNDKICTISEPAVSTTLADLAARGIVRRMNAVEPHEYAVTT